MYIARIRTSSNDKIIAGIVTSFLLMGSYLTLQWTSLPAVKRNTETYEEINWTRFKPPPEKIAPRPEPPEPLKVEKPIEFEPPPAAKPAPVAKIDLSALKSQLASLAKPNQKLSRKNINNQRAAGTKQEPARLNLERSSVLAGLNTLVGESNQKLRLPSRGRGGHGQGTTTALSVGSGTSVNPGGQPDFSSGATLGAPQGKEVNTGTVQIGMLDLGTMRGEFDDLSPIYRALVEWMRRHPAQFSKVVNRFLEKTPGDLTSKVSFQMGGRQFEMFLLCKPQVFEIRICLLEGNESTYLIDRGFKENSRFLRIGSVNRRDTGDILSFSTSRKAASNRRTTAFYQVFLSWWQSVK